MGSCFSSSSGDLRLPAANVISATGNLHRFQTPATVSEVLLHLSRISSSSSSLSNSSFLSNSDHLSYDELIPAMSSDEELVEGQIYFVFHNSKLNRRLSASDLAALAVKASRALNSTSKSTPISFSNSMDKSPQDRRRVRNRISPFVEPEQSSTGGDGYYNYATVKSGGLNIAGKQAAAGGLTRSGSLKRLGRYSSKRAKMAVRSFRLRLSTIHEGSVVQFF